MNFGPAYGNTPVSDDDQQAFTPHALDLFGALLSRLTDGQVKPCG